MLQNQLDYTGIKLNSFLILLPRTSPIHFSDLVLHVHYNHEHMKPLHKVLKDSQMYVHVDGATFSNLHAWFKDWMWKLKHSIHAKYCSYVPFS